MDVTEVVEAEFKPWYHQEKNQTNKTMTKNGIQKHTTRTAEI
jgi:hypothetical protein